MKPGNNLVLEFSTAAYELARLSLSKIIDNSTQYFGLIRHSEENLGANVDSCIKVFNRKNDNTQGKTLKFVINLYHTSSRMVINGSRVDLYLAEIHDKLCDELAINGHMLSVLNGNIASTISTSNSVGTDQNLPAATKTCRDNIADLAIEFRDDESKRF
ncbi:unnamed protein product [Mytilus coruscus]|uniref:Uncharacterized protein n=1 Tax=Mytilus coruscus TaxID=42192 RepID=A0A6J8BCE0_MYTCO|nr:unnamed protein product [Mytilus coruscus]